MSRNESETTGGKVNVGDSGGKSRETNLRSQIVISSLLIPPERIEWRILLIRGQKVMLDADLAELYEVETRELNQAVRRNIERFPPDFHV